MLRDIVRTKNEWVLVQIDGDQFNDVRKVNGIISVETTPKILRGEVLSNGDGVYPKKGKFREPQTDIGDIVYFKREKRTLTDEENLFLVRESDILLKEDYKEIRGVAGTL